MASPAELNTLHRTLADLRSCVGALRSRYGDTPTVRRLATDVERLEIDASELVTSAQSPATVPPEEMQPLTDEPIDPSLWADADDEGIGGYHSR